MSSESPEGPSKKSVTIADSVGSPDAEKKVGIRLAADRKESRRHIELSKWDKDGDGEITIDELLDMASSMRNVRKQRKWLLWAFLGLLIFVIVLVFVMLGVTYWAVTLAKDYRVPASQNGVTYMADKKGNPLSSNTPHILMDDYSQTNDNTTETYKRMVMESPLDSLHRRRLVLDDGDVPAVSYQLLGTFPSKTVTDNLELIKSMSQLTAVVNSGDSTRTTFHLGNVLSIDHQTDHIYIETVTDDGNYFDVDCPLSTSDLCFVTWVTQPMFDFESDNSSMSKRADRCCSDCSCPTSLSISQCRGCGYDGYMCYVHAIGNPAYKTSYTSCAPWNGNCNDCTDCGGFFNSNGELCKKRCPSQAEQCAPSCFPENSLVTLQDGSELPIQLLREGDMVAAVGANGEVIYSPFLTFMHSGKFDKPENYKTIKFTLADNTTGSISASGDHRVYRTKSGLEWGTENYTPARFIEKGDTIFVLSNEKLVPVKVDEVENTKQFGHYGPLTDAGTVIVSGVAASCYVETGPGHYISDIVMTPLKWAVKSRMVVKSIFSADTTDTERTPAEQFPLPGSYIDTITKDVLIPMASYLQ